MNPDVKYIAVTNSGPKSLKEFTDLLREIYNRLLILRSQKRYKEASRVKTQYKLLLEQTKRAHPDFDNIKEQFIILLSKLKKRICALYAQEKINKAEELTAQYNQLLEQAKIKYPNFDFETSLFQITIEDVEPDIPRVSKEVCLAYLHGKRMQANLAMQSDDERAVNFKTEYERTKQAILKLFPEISEADLYEIFGDEFAVDYIVALINTNGSITWSNALNYNQINELIAQGYDIIPIIPENGTYTIKPKHVFKNTSPKQKSSI